MDGRLLQGQLSQQEFEEAWTASFGFLRQMTCLACPMRWKFMDFGGLAVEIDLI